jgi:hypothetical protein
MSVSSEGTPNNPQDPFHYAPRRTNPRLSSVSASTGETPFDRPARPELVRRATTPSSSLSAELEQAVFESLRRQMDPEIIPEPPAVEGRFWRRAWLGVGAAVGVAATAAALFVTLATRDESGASFPAVAASTAQDDATKPALAQFRSLIAANSANAANTANAANEDNQAGTHEQSERLLRQFMQWRQKTNLGDQAR